MTLRRWSVLCTELCQSEAIDDRIHQAFSGGLEAEVATFAALEADSLRRAALPVVAVLGAEVDRAQAEMFSRRYRSVLAVLDRLGGVSGQVLRVALVQRMAEVLAGPPPRALRVRAVADFYYSQAAILYHRRSNEDVPTPAARVAAASWRTVGPGIQHARVAGPTTDGPIHLNLLRMIGGRLTTVDCRGQGSLAEVAARRDAVAAVSGGFFLYSEADILPPSRRTDPVGLLVQDGEVLSPPIFRRAALQQTPAGDLSIGVVGMTGVAICWPEGGEVVVAAENDPAAVGRVPVSFTRARGCPPHTGWSVAIVGRQVTAIARGELEIPLAGAVVVLPHPPPGGVTQVSYRLPTPLRAAMAGGPTLSGSDIRLADEDFCGGAPPITFSRDETFDQNLLPRMAAGLDADGALYFAAIDGRSFDVAPGMTLRGTAAVMGALGCAVAMNLDGGSSKRMVVHGEVVDLPSTEVVSADSNPQRVRPVHSAILLSTDRPSTG